MDIHTIQTIIPQDQAIYLFYTIISAGFVFWVTARIQSYIKSLISLNKVVGSFRISKNNILRFPTAVGTIDGKLLSIDRKRVEIAFPDFIRSIPTDIFANMTWDVVKSKSEIEG